MNTFLKPALSAVLSLSLALPTGVVAQGELPACSTESTNSEYPCKMAGGVARSAEEWHTLDLIGRGLAQTKDEARAILEAETNEAEFPNCGDRANSVPLPCRIGDQTVNSSEEFHIYSLISRGRAGNVAEAQALLEERRAGDDASQEQADAPAQQDTQQTSLPQCGPKPNDAPLPCQMGAQVVQNAEEWRIYNLIEKGQAGNVNEAQAILAERRAENAKKEEKEETPQAEGSTLPEVTMPVADLPQCGPRANETALPCMLNEQVVQSAEEWRIFNLIDGGQANNVAEAQDLLAKRRAEARAAEDAANAAKNAEAREQRREERRAERRAERQAAAATADDTDLDGATEEVVPQESARSSDEEFSTAVTGDGDSGLSKFEKVLLLGLGAVVVGSVLKNGDKVVSRTGDRVVVESPEGDLRVLKDDAALIRRPGDKVQTRTYDDGSTRTLVTKPDGSRVITVLSRDGTVLRRVNVDPQGNPTVIIDDTVDEQEVVVSELPQVIDGSRQASLLQSEDDLRQALAAELRAGQTQRFSLRQVREIEEVRALAPQLELDAVRFETGSAAIRPEQARALARIGTSIRDMIAQDPRTVILVEGHTDATGSATYNLALSDRRAETVALALTEYFEVPPENMITQGYGESSLKVPTLEAEAANRRAVVRNISGLLR